MSLITCCPACGTMFKVVADQLKVSEGWVRCGHCAEIFDATAHLQQPGATAPAVAPPPTAAPPARAAAAPEPRFEPLPRTAQTPWVQPEQDSGYPPFELRRADPGEEAAEPSVTPSDGSSGWTASESPEPPQPMEDLGFLRDARRKAFWRRPAVRFLLVLFAFAFALLLAAQWAIHDRNRLAALQPELVPVLQALCQPLSCTVGPLRRIEAVAIDSSAFTKLRPDLYRLSLTLKNQSAPAVAFPALELTLTDTQDQPVLRRVLAPRELGAATETLAGHGEWSGTIAVAVNANGSTARIAGYRVLAFYP